MGSIGKNWKHLDIHGGFSSHVSFRGGTLPETNSSPLKMDGWRTILSFLDGLFSGAIAVSFRECYKMILFHSPPLFPPLPRHLRQLRNLPKLPWKRHDGGGSTLPMGVAKSNSFALLKNRPNLPPQKGNYIYSLQKPSIFQARC